MRRLTAFTWGYWGWGTHTSDFVRTVDVIVRARGKRPPIFVDIRFSRSVRAPGFSGGAFQKTVGTKRYQWMRKLGNPNIANAILGRPRIADPAGIEELLQLVIDVDRQDRRVIFFCACEIPCNCHRTDVAGLLRKIAGRKRVPLTVIEWPGAEPETLRLAVSAMVIKNVLRGGKRIPLNNLSAKTLRRVLALPWCSRVDLLSDDAALGIVSGPAHKAAGWYLPVIGPELSAETDTVQSLKAEATKLRKSLGYAALL